MTEVIKASEVKVGDTLLTEFGHLSVTQVDHIEGFVLLTGTAGIARVGLPALDADAPVTRLPWAGGRVGGRENFHPDGWDNTRDRMPDEEPQGDTRRLTEDERYGVQFNVDPDTLA
jgi:hypothetical protein